MFSNCHTLYMFIQSSLLFCFKHLKLLINCGPWGNGTLCEDGVIARVSSGLHAVSSWARNVLGFLDINLKSCLSQSMNRGGGGRGLHEKQV